MVLRHDRRRFSLDDNRTPIDANDIPDVLAKWPGREEGPNSYRVPIEKIRANDWSLAADAISRWRLTRWRTTRRRKSLATYLSSNRKLLSAAIRCSRVSARTNEASANKATGRALRCGVGRTPRRDQPRFWVGDAVWVTISGLDGVEINSSKENISDVAVRECMPEPVANWNVAVQLQVNNRKDGSSWLSALHE